MKKIVHIAAILLLMLYAGCGKPNPVELETPQPPAMNRVLSK